MDRHRRDSRDGGESKERRRSKSRDRQERRYSKGHEDSGGNKSKSSRSEDRSRSTRDNTTSGEPSRKRSDNESRLTDESRERKPRDSDRTNDTSNSRRPVDDSKSSRVGRDDAGNRDAVDNTGRDAGRSSQRDSSRKSETFKRSDSNNGCKSSDGMNSRTDKKPRRSRSPSRRESNNDVNVNSKEPTLKRSNSKDDRGEAGRNGDYRDEIVDHKVRSVTDNDGSSANKDDRSRKGSGTREIDDHGRERRSRNVEALKVDSSSSSKREESNKDIDSRRRDSERNRGDGNDRVARGESKGDRVEGRLQIADSLGTGNPDWRSRGATEGKPVGEGSSMRRHQGGPPPRNQNQNQNQYGPGSKGEDFKPSDGNSSWSSNNAPFGGQELGRDRGRGNRDDFNGTSAHDTGMWGTGMSMGGAFAPKMPPFSGWGNGTDERKGMGGVMSGEGFNDDWRQQQSQSQQQFPYQEGSNNFPGSAGGGGRGGGDAHHAGRMDHYSAPPFGDFNQNYLWEWNQSQQQRQQNSSYDHTIPGGGPNGGDKEADSTHKNLRQPRTLSMSQDAPSAPQFKGSRQQRDVSKPPPPPPPPKVSGIRSDSKMADKNRSKDHGREHDSSSHSDNRKHSDRRMSICSNDSDKSRAIKTEEKSHSNKTMEKVPEVPLIPLKWALEDPSVLVSRWLAGNELYNRVLALRGIKPTEMKSENNENVSAIAESREEYVEKTSSGPTLEEMLASVSQEKEEGNDEDDRDADQRAVVSVDDFFGALAGEIKSSSFDADIPPYDEDPPGDDDVVSDTGDDVGDDKDEDGDGDDMYGDLGGEEGNEEDGENDDNDENGTTSATIDADGTDLLIDSTDKAAAKGLSDIPKSTQHSVSKRDYRLPPPGVVEDIPYALQDVSFTRLNIFSRALKGQGFSSFLLQSIPELKNLFRKDLKGKDR